MISYLKGLLVSQSLTTTGCQIVVEVNNIGYTVAINNKTYNRIKDRVNSLIDKYDNNNLSYFYFSINNDGKTNDLKIIIYNDNHDSSTALCLHNTSHEVYMVRGKNIFLQEGGRIEVQISSIALASLEDVATIVNYECDYTTFFNGATSNILQTSYRKLVVDGNPYRIEWFVVVDNVEISQNYILFGETIFQVPVQVLRSEQQKKYVIFHTQPGPHEHCFDLPSECCKKVIRKLVPLES